MNALKRTLKDVKKEKITTEKALKTATKQLSTNRETFSAMKEKEREETEAKDLARVMGVHYRVSMTGSLVEFEFNDRKRAEKLVSNTSEDISRDFCVSIDVKSDMMSDSEDSDDSETKAKPPSKRFEPNVSQFKTNLIPGSAFRSKSQLVRNERCVRRRDHLLAEPREADDGDDSDATIIDETYAETVDDWRNGPAKYWYDLMGLPEDCQDYDYGLKVRNKSASSDWMHSWADTRVDPEDAFNLVSQIKWENEVIWDSDVVAEKVIDRAKKLEPTTGWLPIGVTRSAPDFCKQVDCLNVKIVSDTVDTNNAKTPINGLSKNLRKRKRNSVVNGLSDNRNEKMNETEATVEVKKSRWVSTLAEENRELVLSVWEDEIIWDTEAMDRKLEPKIIPFSGDDDNVILAFDEMMDEDTTDSHTADPLNESTDQFNISNDEFYASVVKVDNNVTHSLIIKHSIPAIKMDAMLFPTCLLEFDRPVLKRSKILRSRVPHDVLFCSNRIQMNGDLNEDQNQTAKDLTKYTINTVSELSARNGEVVVMEYSEEDPPFLMRVGMGSQIVNYFQKTNDKNCVPLEDKYAELRVVTNSPFIGEIGSGKSQLSLETNMFRSPIFRHSCPETDFLIIRTDDNYYIRELNGVYVVGQQLPLIEVPRPKSKHYYDFVKQFAKMFIYRFFDGRKSVQNLETELIKAFPKLSRHFVTRIIRAFTVRKGERYELKSEIPFDNQINNLLTPEDCCTYYTTTIAAHKFKERGFGDRLYLNSDDNCDNQLNELTIAPWNTSVSYIGALNAKKWLTVSEYNEDGSLMFKNQSYKDFKDQMPTIKKCLPISNLSLKRMPLRKAHEWLINYGLSKDRVKKLRNVTECQFMIKELSQKLRENGVRAGISKTATTEQHYRLECQKVFNLQTSYYSSKETYSTDEEDDEEEEEESDSDLEDMGRDLEAMILENKSLEQIEYEREEEERQKFVKSLKGEKSGQQKPQKESLKGKILKIKRIYEINGKRELRTEISFSFTFGFSSATANVKPPVNQSQPKVTPKPLHGILKNVTQNTSQNVSNGSNGCDFANIDIDDSDDWDVVESTVEGRQPLAKVEGIKVKFAKQVVIEANEIENEEQRRIQEEEEEERRSKTVEYFSTRSTTRCRVDPMVKLKEIFDRLIVTCRKREDLSDCIDFFNEAVKPKEAPDYYEIIKTPIDLSTIRLRNSEGKYWTRDQFLKDIQLIYENSVEYNGEDHEITENAQKLVNFCRDHLNERAEQMTRFEAMLATSDYHHTLQALTNNL
ncbi:unnamed protein product [Oppiella nova]|uniref:Bromo domain-containing protein n=1 Tax=Oppiella nova TaxID=334625 RepID=A0A7R9LSZ1_9ACAR|nr:unnamed protein product [Oppiella nova]CAG2166654.1 unnamed protein product [Oppiella nova]